MPDGSMYAVKVYVPDEDTIQTATTIDLLFDFQAHFGLDLVQPSLCSPADSYTSDPSLFQRQPTALRFIAWVDVTVPAFSMTFLLKRVLPTLRHARTGEAAAVDLRCVGGVEAAAACKARAESSIWVSRQGTYAEGRCCPRCSTCVQVRQLHWACRMWEGFEAVAACHSRADLTALAGVAAPAFSMRSLLQIVLPTQWHRHTGEAAGLCGCMLLIAAVCKDESGPVQNIYRA